MKRVFVGLSGGVDSGTSAALLKEQGYVVTGVFIKIWQPEFIECTWRKDRLDAIRVASALGIPYKEVDLSHQYKKEVIDSMVHQYASGITPNPDVLCNEKIKFGVFAQWAWQHGADFVATGHYAQTCTKNGQTLLVRGADANKDQSYFLYRISQDDLKRTLFPIGNLQKSEVRIHARKFGLPVAEKPDSQGLCFVGDISMATFLSRFMNVSVGDVLDMNDHVIGKHDGAALYTIGQRHGFRLMTNSPEAGSHYVVAIDTHANTITVSENKEDAARHAVELTGVHWTAQKLEIPVKVLAQSRYRETPFEVELAKIENKIICTFKEPKIVSPGQSLVLYKDDVCLGGGFIV